MKHSQADPAISPVGVSIVICCHNSSSRLGETLRCMAEQEGTEGISWEVIVVDNGSTDDTVQVARDSWPEFPLAPLRIVSEPNLGQSHARICGFNSATFEYVSFVDDDNRVARDWIHRAYIRMASNPEIGACGAKITADFEMAVPPQWWEEFEGCFAVGQQWPEQGDVTQTKGWMYGAGLTIRKSAWAQLRGDGFRFFTLGRRGKAVTGGEDNELCYALRLSGWKLWLDWSMQIRHFMPQGRITWSYVRRLYRGAGATSLILCGYDARPPVGCRDRLRMQWWWQMLATVKQLLLHPLDYYAYAFSRREGDHAVLRTESRLGRLAELLRLRGKYRTMLIELQNANWRKQVPTLVENSLNSVQV